MKHRTALAFLFMVLSWPAAVSAAGRDMADKSKSTITISEIPGIIGQDDRRIENSEFWPWSSIGKLNMAETGSCTATLVAPKIVLTAGHCLLRRRDRGIIRPSSVHFLAGYDRGSYLFHATATALIISPSIKPGLMPADFKENDWALVVLDTEIPLKPIPIETTDPKTPRPALRAGYSRDRAHVLTVVRGCQLLGSDSSGMLYAHDCDATMGDSGSPVMVGDEHSPVIAGINIGIAGLGGKSIDLAVPAVRFVDQISQAILASNEPKAPAK